MYRVPDIADAASPSAEPHELRLLSSARRVLAQARSIDEVKGLRDKAAAVKAYAEKAKLGRELVVEASVVRLEAERRLGELLKATTLATATRGNQHAGRRPDEANGVRLADLGVTKGESSRSQRLAEVPEEAFAGFVRSCLDEGRQATIAAALREASTPTRPAPAATPRATNASGETVDSLTPLVAAGRRFGCVYAAPPWPHESRSTRGGSEEPDSPLSVDQVTALPVADLAAERAHLHLWTTDRFLRESLGVLDAWGFKYESCLVWVKPPPGPGDYWRVSHELLLLGVLGGLPFADRGCRSWVEAPPSRHSEKPAVVRSLVESVSPGPYLELFGRRPVAGWTVYGDRTYA